MRAAITIATVPLLISAVRADTAAPTTRPAPDEATIARLIVDLGSDTFATREAAMLALLKTGKAAEPQLRDAAEHAKDPEVRGRATVLLARLAQPPAGKVLRAVGPALAQGPKRVIQARVVRPGINELTVTTRDAAAVIRSDADGIAVTVSSTADGFQSEKYAAKTPDELARSHPAAYELYDAVVTKTGGGRKEGRDFRAWFENPPRVP
jgi:hypothetical protein